MIIEHALTIHAPVAEVYRVSQDYAVRYLWDPFPEHIEMLNGATQVAIGTQVMVLAKSGLRMEVEFVQVRPPESAAIVMTRGPLFLQAFAGSWNFRADGDRKTQAKFRYSLKMKRWTLPMLSEKLAGLYFRHMVIKRLTGLQAYCEKARSLQDPTFT